MKPVRIQMKPVEMTEILDCVILKQVNQHMEAHISGIIKDRGILSHLGPETEIYVEAVSEEGETRNIFRGILCGMVQEEEGGITKLEIHGKSRTVLLDQAENRRFYYSQKQTFQSIVEDLVSKTEQVRVIYGEGSKNLCGLIAQYGETDWEFLKRLASRIGEVVVADGTNSNICIYFGMPRKKEESPDIRSYRLRTWDGGMEYEAESRDILDICAPIEMDGKRVYVYKSESRLRGSELVTRYCLREREGFWTKAYGNEKLTGVSFLGRVSKVCREKVRIECDYGYPKGERDTVWFPFATVYSSPAGTGWYCMPEEGDRVRLYFPDREEEHAYGMNAVHLDCPEGRRENPEEKSFRTSHDKEIRFTPDQIRITNHKGMSIILDDEKGILIKSSRDIRIVSEEGIEMESAKEAQILAGKGILFRENHNSLSISDGIRHTGLMIEYQ